MAKNDIVQGGDLMLFKVGGTTQAPTYTSFACATSHSISVSTETSDTSHKDISGSWKSSAIKSFSWEATTENLFTLDPAGSGYFDLYDLMTNKTKVKLIFSTKTDAALSTTSGWAPDLTGDYLEGEALITALQENAPNGDNVTYTVTFTGVGPLAHQS